MSDLTPFGLLLVDKPVGPTSHDIIDVARRVLKTKKVGHTGTLDPFATGLLVLCVGPATRIAEYLVGLDKSYEAEALLGVETDSYDRNGAVVAEDEAWKSLTAGDVEAALARLCGQREQRPPVFSAVKVGGVPAHRRVRRGETVELAARPVRIDRLDLEGFEPPRFSIRVDCSAGTYIRSLAQEASELLGTGCHLTELRRTAVGSMHVRDAMGLGALREARIPDGAWVEPAQALGHLPSVAVDLAEAARLAMGQAVPHPGSDLPSVAVVGQTGDLLAVGAVEDGFLKPRKVFVRG